MMGTVGRSGGKGSAWGKRREKMFCPVNTERTTAEYGVLVISGHCWWNGSLLSTVGMPAWTRK